MDYTEKLTWILDKLDKEDRKNYYDGLDEKIRENVDFVHSLGLKCDCAGWSDLDLNDPRAEEILGEIVRFCKQNGWKPRGYYKREYINVESDWYTLSTEYLKDNTWADTIITQTEDGQEVKMNVIRAYYETSLSPKNGKSILLHERFRDSYIKNNMSGLDFCWAKDVGKYEASQFFHTYGKNLIPHALVDWGLDKGGFFKIYSAGGWLPKLSKIFYKLNINMPYCFLKQDMPDGGIAYAYIPQTFSCCGMEKIFVHKDIAKLLLADKAIPESALRPAVIVDRVPGGYTVKKTSAIPRPNAAFIDKMLEEYEKLKSSPRPIRKISEKDALKLLRKAKTERK